MWTENGILKNYYSETPVRRLVIPDDVRMIGREAFAGTSGLEEVVIPNHVTKIEQRAFVFCPDLKNVIIGDGVTEIGRGAFESCEALASVRLPFWLTVIPDRLFCGCRSLAAVDIPDGVSHIGHEAFGNCRALRSVRLPEGISKLDNNAFDGDESLKYIELPSGVESVDYSAFRCTGLERVLYRGMDIRWNKEAPGCSYGDFYFSKTFSEGIQHGVIETREINRHMIMPMNIAYYIKTRTKLFGIKKRTKTAGTYIKENLTDVIKFIISTGSMDFLEAVAEDFIDNNNVDEYIGLATDSDCHEAYLCLVEHKNRLGGYDGENSGRFGL